MSRRPSEQFMEHWTPEEKLRNELVQKDRKISELNGNLAKAETAYRNLDQNYSRQAATINNLRREIERLQMQLASQGYNP